MVEKCIPLLVDGDVLFVALAYHEALKTCEKVGSLLSFYKLRGIAARGQCHRVVLQCGGYHCSKALNTTS